MCTVWCGVAWLPHSADIDDLHRSVRLGMESRRQTHKQLSATTLANAELRQSIVATVLKEAALLGLVAPESSVVRGQPPHAMHALRRTNYESSHASAVR